MTEPSTPPPTSRGFALPLAAGLLGLAVGASLVAGAFLIFDSDGSGSSDSISAPDKVGEYSRFADLEINKKDAAKKNIDRINRWNKQSADRLSGAYNGSGAAIELYADAKIDNQFSVQIVRARAPFPPFVPFTDPADLGLAKPDQELVEFGEVACAVRNSPTPAGQQPEEDSANVMLCMRTSSSLTVQITSVTGDLGRDPRKVADLVNDVWSKVS
jgi:hypothetical protein